VIPHPSVGPESARQRSLELNDLAFDQLERFCRLEIFDHEELVLNGFDVVPTFRTPHVTIAFSGEAVAWLVG